MTTPAERKKAQSEGDEAAEQVGDNRRAGDADGNKVDGDSKSPGVTSAKDQTQAARSKSRQ